MKAHGNFARLANVARLALAVGAAASLAACQEETGSIEDARAYYPIPQATLKLMASKGTSANAPVLIRTFKKESEFEIWKMRPDGRYVYIKTFPMCRWSGQLGPKTREGDRQVPEGFYSIAPGQMNPNSHYYLSFNVGYPNAFDKAHGDTGGDIMVHGICSSAGCFSMTNEQIAEIYAIAREAFAGGQREIQMQSYPFHMTARNLAKFRLDPNMPFWKQLKEGSDYFKVTGQAPQVGVCDRHYVFDAKPVAGGHLNPTEPCPPLQVNATVAAAVAAKERQDDAQVAALVQKGVEPVLLVYEDGSQNPAFASKEESDVSRPAALEHGPIEIALDGKLTPAALKIAVADAKAGIVLPPKGVEIAKVVRKSSSRKASQIAKAAASAPGRRRISQVAAAAPAPAAPKQDNDGPFYRRWLALVSDKLSGAQPERAAQPQSAAQPGDAQFASAPLPPSR